MSSDHIPLMYVESDLPEDVTLVEWRRSRAGEARAAERRRGEERARRRAERRRGLRERLRPGLVQPGLRVRAA